MSVQVQRTKMYNICVHLCTIQAHRTCTFACISTQVWKHIIKGTSSILKTLKLSFLLIVINIAFALHKFWPNLENSSQTKL